MRRWVGLTLFAVIVLGGAFALSALAVEWRQETTDLSPLITEVQGLNSEVSGIKNLVETPTDFSPLITQIQDLSDEVSEIKQLVEDSPTPGPTVRTLEAGTIFEWEGYRLTVESAQPDPTSGTPGRLFTIENLAGAPSTAAAFADTIVTASDGSLCRPGLFRGPDTELDWDIVEMYRGEKLTFGVSWECPNNSLPETLAFDDVVVFQFVQL